MANFLTRFVLACSATITAAGTIHAESKYRYDLASTAALGSGFNASTLDVADKCIEDPSPPTFVAGGAQGQQLKLFVDRIETEAELKEKMNITIAAEVKYFGLGLDASMGLSNAMSQATSTTNFLVKASVVNNTKIMTNPRLTQHAAALLSQGPPGLARFKELCGTEFVSGFRTGGYLFALLQINKVEEIQAKEIRKQLTLGYGAADLSVEKRNQLSKSFQKLNTTINVVRIGGSGHAAIFGDVLALYDAIRDFPKQVSNEGGAPIEFITRRYGTVPLPSDNLVFETRVGEETLRDAYRRITQLRSRLGELRSLHLEATEAKPGTSAWFQQAIADVIDSLKKQERTYRTLVRNCIRSEYVDCRELDVHQTARERKLLQEVRQFVTRKPEGATLDLVCRAVVKVIEVEQEDGVTAYKPLPPQQWKYMGLPKSREGDEEWLRKFEQYRSSALYDAVYENRVDLTQDLLRNGVDPLNLSAYECWEERFGFRLRSPNLIWSAIYYKRDERIIRMLVERQRYFLPVGDMFGRGTENGQTVLHIAALRNVADDVMEDILFLSGLEDLEAVDRFGYSAVHYAVKAGLQSRKFLNVRHIVSKAKRLAGKEAWEQQKMFVSKAVERWLLGCLDHGAGALSNTIVDKVTSEILEGRKLSVEWRACSWAEDLPEGGLIRGRSGEEYWRIEDLMPKRRDYLLLEKAIRGFQ